MKVKWYEHTSLRPKCHSGAAAADQTIVALCYTVDTGARHVVEFLNNGVVLSEYA